MRVAMLGTGYVGLVTGTCFANSGHRVTCADIDQAKIDCLERGEIPIYEPGLAEMVAMNVEADRLHFTTDIVTAVAEAQVVYLAVGTPQAEDGSADLTALRGAVDMIAPHIPQDAVVVVKSTVPVGTNSMVHQRLNELTGRDCDVASNPEFLREGAAIRDFLEPDRIVVGVRRAAVAQILRELHAEFINDLRPLLVMSPESAELTKYVANAMLATKISFINEMANLCEQAGGNVDDIRQGIGHDQRIGFAFLQPGAGYGGSCFPKDVRALSYTARTHGLQAEILAAVDQVNNRQKWRLSARIDQHFASRLRGLRVALWGLAFKPLTDDIREAPALTSIDFLLQRGAQVSVHDPEAMPNVRDVYGDALEYCDDPWEAVDGAHALLIHTEWDVYRHSDPAELKRRLAKPVIFDGRNLFEPEQLGACGLTYYSIGRPAINPPSHMARSMTTGGASAGMQAVGGVALVDTGSGVTPVFDSTP